MRAAVRRVSETDNPIAASARLAAVNSSTQSLACGGNSLGEQTKVFISSVLNPALEDLRSERQIAREVVESYRFMKAWAFEKAPASFEDLDESYLRNVEECDVFLLLVGAEATNPVVAEVQRAKLKNKPILVFAKSSAGRKPTAKILLESVGTKYVSFRSSDELRDAIRDAIDQTLVLGARALSGAPRSQLGELRQLRDKGVQFHVSPRIPPIDPRRTFHIESVDARMVQIFQNATGESITIPTSRVAEIMPPGASQNPTLLLDGRLQWVTTIQRWRFFPEKPETGSTLGFFKASTLNDPRAVDLCEEFRSKGFEPGWAAESELPGKLTSDFQMVYDEDGLYFRIPDRLQSLALIVRRLPR